MPDGIPAQAAPARGADPLAARSPLAIALFHRYLLWYVPRHFHAVRLAREGWPVLPAGRPVVVFTNHPSWWDPAMFVLLHCTLMRGRRGHGPMEAAALARYGVLRRMGLFGIEADSRAGAQTFLRLGARVLGDPSGVLWVTAQGRFADARQRPVVLRPGLAHLARLAPDALLLPLAAEYPFWNESRPEALLRFGTPVEAAALRGRSAREGTRVLEAALELTMDDLARDAVARDAAPFRMLLEGGAGVGGVYDLWRRGRAVVSGRSFDPSHDRVPGSRA
ncbi:MAG: lysophospholipid acyltransferase family protein [Janthinobacterium lividum]